ncbi:MULTISPECIES: aminoglycoside N(3)-acetyltransferase [Halorussus]|uniref:aminoglycoside N(3)-acetyltransferase n=1 Tax=Halorussus TaxID=1070314 RepID=UPI0020A220E0|nr:AAC(3) family N-acetyltransferase [Halorussus vallis]USZ75186.1 AAC(3) family N-acetyltransferase [Halorussus vallis]
MSDDSSKSGEARAVERADEPLAVERLADDLRELGVTGETVLVHSSLSELGWVAGGAPTVVDALMEAVTERGTLMMPTHSTQYSDPADWENPPIPDDWETSVRASMPPYRPTVTPTRGMGAIPECFRTYPDVVRSRHPTYSFAAWGADADEVVGDHGVDHGLGERSPLARVYDRGGFVLLLGADHDSNTSLHLAEHRADYERTVVTNGAPVLRRRTGAPDDEAESSAEGAPDDGSEPSIADVTESGDETESADGEREWISFEEIDYDSGDFRRVGEAFERDRPEAVARGRVGRANAALLDQRALVDYGAAWFEKNRE